MDSYKYPLVPPIRPEDYKWKQSSTDPALWQRRACGSEALFGIEASKIGHTYIFSSAIVQLQSNSHTTGDVAKAARRAWLKLRFDHPQIACLPGYDRQSNCLIQYRAPQHDQEAKRWAEKTIIVEASHRTPMAIREDYITTRKDAAYESDSVTIQIIASVENESTPLEEKELLFIFQANHLFFDGIGLRELVGTFFKMLAQTLTSDLCQPPKHIDWEKNAWNLSPAAAELMDPAQETSGPGFQASVRSRKELLPQGQMWEMDTLKLAEGEPEVVFHTFTQQESEEIVRDVKQKISLECHITHLAQTAILLAFLKIKPPIEKSSINQFYLCQSPVNCRRFMVRQIANHETPYFPNSQSIAEIIFNNIKEYYVPEERQTRNNLRDVLTRGIQTAKAEWVSEMNRSHQLSASISMMESKAARILASKNWPKIVAAPFLASDGTTERYISREYFANASKKEKVLSINDVFFSRNYVNSSVGVHLSSFRDRARLSVDFNTKFYTMETMQSFLTSIADYMKVFAGDVGTLPTLGTEGSIACKVSNFAHAWTQPERPDSLLNNRWNSLCIRFVDFAPIPGLSSSQALLTKLDAIFKMNKP